MWQWYLVNFGGIYELRRIVTDVAGSRFVRRSQNHFVPMGRTRGYTRKQYERGEVQAGDGRCGAANPVNASYTSRILEKEGL